MYTCFLELSNIQHPAFHIINDKLFNSKHSKLLMIKEFKTFTSEASAQNFLCLGYKTNNWRIEKKLRPQNGN